MNLTSFFTELKRRSVYKVAVAYAVVSWLLIQIATQVFPFLEIPNWAIRLVIVLLALGFPIALILAWAFELTPEGIKRAASAEGEVQRSRSRVWVYVALIAGALSLGLFFLGRYTASNRRSATVISDNKSIAVLPFESLSEDKSNAYFADGIQDQILARLSKIADLKVISRTSTQKYKSAPANLREIAQQLGVTNILEGSVQKAGDQVRITVQLINALKDNHLWADTYDRNMSNVFSVESDVAQKIAESLEAKLTGREKKAIAFIGTNNPAAYDALLHGLALRGSQDPDEVEKERGFFRRAVELDPNYAQAWAYLGGRELDIYPTVEQREKARREIETAIRLAPEMEEGHVAMGLYKYYALRDFDGALAELEIARAQEPNDWSVFYFSGLVLRRQGKIEEALRSMQQAAALDPLNQDIAVNLASTYRGMRRFDEARAMFDRALTIAPNDQNILANKAETYLAQGDLDKAWEIVSKLKLSPKDATLPIFMGTLQYRREYDEMVRQAQAILAKEPDYPPLVGQITHAATAMIYLMKGDRAAALPYAERARRDREELRRQKDVIPGLQGFYIIMEGHLGNRAEVEREIQELFDKTRNDKWEFPNAEASAAIGYTQLGDFDRALPLIQNALTQPSALSLTTAGLRLDPNWDPIRNDPRFRKLYEEKKP
ncbi:MAG: tetratricopeptide repeat protein [Chthoniobacterales bacterium]|nr:tetratricopeptide repeat protein [Chthoniobacterales bacterium]